MRQVFMFPPAPRQPAKHISGNDLPEKADCGSRVATNPRCNISKWTSFLKAEGSKKAGGDFPTFQESLK